MARTNSSAPQGEPPDRPADELSSTSTTPSSRDPDTAAREHGRDADEAGAIAEELAAERIDQVSDGDPV
jgi:hypothetical protein